MVGSGSGMIYDSERISSIELVLAIVLTIVATSTTPTSSSREDRGMKKSESWG